MHSVRLICFALGAWITGGFFMTWVATEGFRGADRLLGEPNPTARLQFKTLDAQQNSGPNAARMLLRYQVSEQNRFYFESWEIVQVVLGSLLFFFMLFGTREDKYSLVGVLLMLSVTMVQRFLLTPEIVVLGRAMDFARDDAVSPQYGRFWMLHKAYVSVELTKWAIGLIAAGRLITGRHRSSRRHVREQLDLVDKADHRHIDR